MDWFRNIKIQNKLFLIFGLLIVFVIILGGVSVVTTDKIEKEYINLVDGPQQRAIYAANAARELNIMRQYILSMIYLAENNNSLNAYYELFRQSRERLLNYRELYCKSLENDVFLSENEINQHKALTMEIDDLFFNKFETYVVSVYHAARDKDSAKISEILSYGIPLGDEISAKLAQLRLDGQETANNIRIKTNAYSHESKIKVIFISVFIAFVAFVVSIFISRIIREPIVRIESAMQEISKGNLAYPIRSGYKDELGMLSNHIGDMVDTISALNKSVSIIDNLDDIIFVTDFDYNMTYYNQKVAEVFNIEQESGLNQKCYKILSDSDSPCEFCPLPKLLPAKDTFPSFGWERNISINGKDLWYVCRTSIIRWFDGTLVQICTCKDASVQKEKERVQATERENEQIRVSQQSLQTVLDALPIPVRIVDLENNHIVYVNNSLVDLLEYDSPEEVCGLKLREILPECTRDGKLSSKLIDMTVNSKKIISFEVDYKTKSGRIITSLLSTRHIEYRGRLSSIGIIKDLTAERERARILKNAADREREANQSKSRFLANMSHEIRTPMNGIIGFSELALDDDIPQVTKDYLHKIKSSAESLLQIINNILDISKIESGKMELEKIPFEISDVFNLCRTIATPKALEKGITLFCYAEPSVGRIVLGDPTKLRQALLNLLTNAVKFTNTGMVKLSSFIMGMTENTVTIRFEVKDNGIGMSPEQIVRIFDPFVQADTSVTRKYGGTGLGLSITKNIISLMGGELKVESALGLGSKFSFDLTFETIKTPDEPFRPVPADIIKKPRFEGEVLVCEDNELNQQVICDHLSRVGLKTVIANNGKIGIDYVKRRIENNEKPFDLIFMDIHMPVMDGLEAAQKLAEMKNTKPVIALTANVMSDDISHYQIAGMRDCIPKPFSANELWSCLLKYLTPVGMTAINKAEQNADDEKQQRMIIKSFVKNHQTTFIDINKAVQNGDIQVAHRLAHTLKGTAELVGMPSLQKAAQVIELSLEDGKAEFTDEQMNALAVELNTALNELAPLVNTRQTPPAETTDMEKRLDLFAKLESLLESDSFDCLLMLDELEKISGTELLIEHLEKFDFKKAREALASIRDELGCGNEGEK